MTTHTIKNVLFEDVWVRLSDAEKFVCCTRSYDQDGWESFIGWNPTNSYSGNNVDDFKKYVAKEQWLNRRLFGYLSYNLGYSLLKIFPTSKNDLQMPDICFYSFDAYVSFLDGDVNLVTSSEDLLSSFISDFEKLLRRPENPRSLPSEGVLSPELSASTDAVTYSKSYQKVKEYIFEGDIYQMNLAHRLEGRTNKSGRRLFVDACEKNKVGYIAYVEGPDFEVISASPEQFIRISAERDIETKPVKGTRPRGKTSTEDILLMHELLDSPKETAELNMITDLLRNDLGKISRTGSVKVIERRNVRAHSTVWHTYSRIKAKLLPGLSSTGAILSMFPGGSITGCPKKRAVEIIDELEPVMRGVYTGCIGIINPDDSSIFNIAIRTIVKKGAEIFLSVGGGIVYDSKEKDEYSETLEKAKSFLGII
jgi:para-aminobenzoate synthetase component I